MLQSDELPEELNISLGSENREFAVKGAFAQPVIVSVFGILSGAGWLGFTFLLMSFFIDPGFFREAIESFTSSEAADSGEGEKFYYLFIIVFFGIFLSVGLYMVLKGIFSLFRNGGYFVGTPTRLVHFRKGKLKTFDWEQFTSDIVVKGNNNKGNITMVMKTGSIVRSKNSSRFVPDYIYMLRIEGALDIEQIIRRRIRENDPNIMS